jgi:hypothetical protein
MKRSELRQIIKEELKRSLNEKLGPDPGQFFPPPDTRGWNSSDVERIMGNFKDEEYLPAMNSKDRKILIAVLERYLDPKY